MREPLHHVLSCLSHEPAQDYHAKAGTFLSSHLLAKFRQSPSLYHRATQGLLEQEERPAYLVGSAAHTMILEGEETYRREYSVGGPRNPKTGKPYGAGTKAFIQWAEREGKPVLTESQHDLIMQMADSVHRHGIAERLLDDGVAEGVLRCKYRDVACQVRIDWFSPQHGIVDLKTCNDMTWFEADARRFGYLHQMAFYRSVASQFASTLVPVHIIAVEKQEPYRCGVWQVGQDVLGQCQKENQEAIERLKRCQANDHWPTGYEQIRQFDYV